LTRTKPPDVMGWLHTRQAGASSVMRRTPTERRLRPGAIWVWALPGAGVTCVAGPQTSGLVRRCACASSSLSQTLTQRT
jgi:hypothetical protein